MAKEVSFPEVPAVKGEPNEVPSRLELAGVSERKGDEFVGCEKLRLGLSAPRFANADLGAALPKDAPFKAPPKAPKGDVAEVSFEKPELAKAEDPEVLFSARVVSLTPDLEPASATFSGSGSFQQGLDENLKSTD